MNDHNLTLCREFVVQAKEILASNPQVKHKWSIDEEKGQCLLEFPKVDSEGFNITVEVNSREIIVFVWGFHQHFDQNDIQSNVESSLGLVRDLLSPDMRIKEFLAGGSPYRWDAELLQDGKWIREHTTCLMFWNYFGKRSHKYYQNKVLAGRFNNLH